MNKAFNVVEITVIILVFGIIMLLVSKGKSVYNDAKFIADVTKIYKLQENVISYVNNYGSNDNISIDNLQNTTNGNYITPQDVKLTSAGLGTKLVINRALLAGPSVNIQENYKYNKYYKLFRSYETSFPNIVITIMEDPNTNLGDKSLPMAIIFSCKVDAALDDGGRLTGHMLISTKDYNSQEISDNIIADEANNKFYTSQDCETLRYQIKTESQYSYPYSLNIIN